MSYQVLITSTAESDMLANHRWWAENRSGEQANRWLSDAYSACLSLATEAQRYPLASEPSLRKLGVHQLLFGLGRRPTHRILYGIDGKRAVVLRIRSLRQDTLTSDDLA